MPSETTNDAAATDIAARVASYQQEHLLAFWDELSVEERARLTEQISAIDFAQIAELISGDSSDDDDWDAIASRATSPPAIRLSHHEKDRDELVAIEAAEHALRSGKLGVVLVAGGQGSRLGFPHPKGMYPIGPVSNRTLFEFHVDQILALNERYGVSIPLYLMTSPATHVETIEYFRQHNNLGLADDDLHFFCQGTMPAVDAETGKILLADRGEIFVNPDGHGGMLEAFDKSGCLNHASSRGVEQLFYFQVDNPLVSICDRRLLGFHLLRESELTTQVIAKTNPLERVGNVVLVDGRMMVIEYSDLPESAARRTDHDGELELWAGSIAVHVFDLAFLQRASLDASSLPFHRAHKAVSYIDGNGEQVVSTVPNAIKFERFIFDLMPSANNAIVVEADVDRVFAPLKNASGAAKDTPETTRAAIVRESKRMLEQAGISVADDVAVEINPRFAFDANELPAKVTDRAVSRDTYFTPLE